MWWFLQFGDQEQPKAVCSRWRAVGREHSGAREAAEEVLQQKQMQNTKQGSCCS